MSTNPSAATGIIQSVYLDSAATTQMREEVVMAMTQVLSNTYGNPSSTHSYGRESRALIETARKQVAALMNVSAGEIIFTSGGTEADNIAIQCAVRDRGVMRIITSRIEHHAVLHTVENMAQYDVAVDFVDLMECGTPDLEHLRQLLEANDSKTLVSLMHVNNEVGNMIDVEAVGTLCREHDALFHCDMVQSIGHFAVDLCALKVDFTAASAHKFHGPKGVGFAYVRKGSGLKPLIMGGGQERGLRAGTESVHNIVGLATALQLAYDNLEEERNYIQGLKSYMQSQLEKYIPDATFNGACAHEHKSTYTLLNVCIPCTPEKALMLLFNLDLKGIACSKGSACQSGAQSGSHVLREMQSESDQAKPSLRFSFSRYNTKEEIDYVIQTLVDILA